MSAIAGFLRQLTLAFGAGMVGTVFLFLAGRAFTALKVQSLLGFTPNPPPPLPEAAYRPLVWGGIFGLLLVIPLLNRWWWLKGILLGLAPVIAQLLYFNPALKDAPAGRIAYSVLIHVIFGLGAALWWRIVSVRAESTGQRFSAYR
jgi:hypothetical protein